MGPLARKALTMFGLAVVVLVVPVQAAMAGPGIGTTRPLSDARFDVDLGDRITTTRPLSDTAFAVRAGVDAEAPSSTVNRRVLSDAGFEPVAPAGGSTTDRVSTTNPSPAAPIVAWIAVAALLTAVSAVLLGRRRRSLRAA